MSNKSSHSEKNNTESILASKKTEITIAIASLFTSLIFLVFSSPSISTLLIGPISLEWNTWILGVFSRLATASLVTTTVAFLNIMLYWISQRRSAEHLTIREEMQNSQHQEKLASFAESEIDKVISNSDAKSEFGDELPFHPRAEELAKRYATVFSRALIRYSQNIAFQREDESVLSNHVKQAFEIIQREPSSKKRSQEITIFMSSVILGICGQSLVSEVLKFGTQPPTGSITATFIYALFSFVAAITATIAFFRS
jgi:hypothetical protein